METKTYDFPIGLAPMAGFTDRHFRLICSENGADYTVSEMISATAICHNDKKTASLAVTDPNEAPCALQIFGHDPAVMAYAAQVLICGEYEGYKKGGSVSAIEINMGCPVNKIVSNSDGCALMKNPKLASKITRAVSDAVKAHGLKLWVKIRAGWDKNSINAPDFALMLSENGADRITVHGRTREMMYAPSSDNTVIRQVRELVDDRIEVIGNGDICCADDALKMIDETGADGVLVGRAALGNPWIFDEIKAGMRGEAYPPASVKARVEVALRLLRDTALEKGEYTAVRESRGRAAHLIRGINGAAAARDALNRAQTYEEFKRILMELL